MFNSFPFSNTINIPLVSTDNLSSCLNYLMDNLPSPYFCDEISNFDYLISNHDSSTIDAGSIANHNSDFNTSILTDDSSIVEVDNKVDLSKVDEVNGILENQQITLNKNSSIKTKKKKRSSNKDRHSKIRTAHGLRDRRMRLSLQVARPFFKLQDILGFDKASKTVEWLLAQSNTAIQELFRSNNGSSSGVLNCSMSSISDDCEVQSTIINETKESSKAKKRSLACVRKDEPRQKRKMTTREERKKARDKARKRTLEKLQGRGIADDTNCLGNQIPLSSLNYQQSYDVCPKVPTCTISTLTNMFGGPQ